MRSVISSFQERLSILITCDVTRDGYEQHLSINNISKKRYRYGINIAQNLSIYRYFSIPSLQLLNNLKFHSPKIRLYLTIKTGIGTNGDNFAIKLMPADSNQPPNTKIGPQSSSQFHQILRNYYIEDFTTYLIVLLGNKNDILVCLP